MNVDDDDEDDDNSCADCDPKRSRRAAAAAAATAETECVRARWQRAGAVLAQAASLNTKTWQKHHHTTTRLAIDDAFHNNDGRGGGRTAEEGRGAAGKQTRQMINGSEDGKDAALVGQKKMPQQRASACM
jgi:hypothetical protein